MKKKKNKKTKRKNENKKTKKATSMKKKKGKNNSKNAAAKQKAKKSNKKQKYTGTNRANQVYNSDGDMGILDPMVFRPVYNSDNEINDDDINDRFFDEYCGGGEVTFVRPDGGTESKSTGWLKANGFDEELRNGVYGCRIAWLKMTEAERNSIR